VIPVRDEDQALSTGEASWTLLPRFPFVALLSRLHEGTKDVVHEGLVTLAVRSEPFQDIVIDADIDMVFAGRDSHNAARPIGFTVNVIYVGADGRLQFGAGYRVDLIPIRSVFTVRNLGFNLFSRIAHGIASLPHLSLSLP
jgi:hypothetical protein